MKRWVSKKVKKLVSDELRMEPNYFFTYLPIDFVTMHKGFEGEEKDGR